MKRRTILQVLGTFALGASASCAPPDWTSRPTPSEPPPPTAEEALEIVGLPVPQVELTATEGVHLSDLDEWSLLISFTATSEVTEAWLAEAFPGAHGLPVLDGGVVATRRIPPEIAIDYTRYFDGTNPKDPSASYAVVTNDESSDVVIAAARSSR